jgi:hypothetical protein
MLGNFEGDCEIDWANRYGFLKIVWVKLDPGIIQPLLAHPVAFDTDRLLSIEVF